MKERPILFSGAMVRAILEGRKTQTRRAVKPQPPADWQDPEEGIAWRNGVGFCGRQRVQVTNGNGEFAVDVAVIDFPVQQCRYGTPGDRLWVRETFREAPQDQDGDGIEYRADRPEYRKRDDDPSAITWTPSIYMPRWASRITLEVTGVRVERLKDISEADAAAEGVEPLDSTAHEEREDFDHSLCGNCGNCGGRRLYDGLGPNMGVMPDTDCRECETHVQRYRWLWESINGPESWAANPWVWVVEFKRVTP